MSGASSSSTDPVVVLITAPSIAVAEQIATAAVGARAAACVSVLPGVRSTYRWQGAIEHADEVQLVVKSSRDRLAALKDVVAATHPYKVPELIVLPIVDGLPAYLAWIVDETRPATAESPC